MKRKLLSFVLSLAMVLALIPGGSIVSKAADVTDTLNLTTTGVSGTNYTDWSGKTGNSGAVYAGQSAGGNNSIQLRSKNSNSGIVTTASGGTVKSISVVWNSNTANGRTLQIYGKNTAYSAPTDLYNNSNKGTLLGTIVCGTSTSLTVSDDYAFIGMRSASDAMFLTSVSIVWDDGQGGHEHSYAWNGTKGVDGMHTLVCSNTDGACTALTKTEACTLGDPVVVSATCVTAGSSTKTCTVCGYSEVTSLPATGVHVDEDNDGICDQCLNPMPEQIQYELVDGLANDEYVLGVIHGTVGADSEIGALNGTFENGWVKYELITPNNGVITNPDPECVWILTIQEGGGFTLKNKSTEEYLICTAGTGSGSVTVGSDGSTLFASTISAADNTFKIHPSLDSTNQLALNFGSGYGYRMYAKRDQGNSTGICVAIRFYRLVGDHEHTYTWNGTTGTNGYHTEICTVSGCNESREVPCTLETLSETPATCSTAGSKTEKCSVCGFTKTTEIPATGEHVDADYDYLCDNCGTEIVNPETVVRAVYDLTAGQSLSGEYTLVGPITEIITAYDSGHENITVDIAVTGANEPNVIRCYRLKASSVAGMSEEIVNLAVGDTIVVKGQLTKYHDSANNVDIPEFKSGCELLAVTKGSNHEHSYSWDGTVGSYGKHTEVCSNSDGQCSALTRQVACTYGTPEVVAATCTVDGVKKSTCTVCGYEFFEVIPATGNHNDADGDGLCDECHLSLSKTVTWEKVASFDDLADGDIIAITGLKTGDYYTLSTKRYIGSNGTVGAPAPIKVTVTNDTFSTVETDIVTHGWVITKISGGFSLKPYGNDKKILVCGDDNNGLRIEAAATTAKDSIFYKDGPSGYFMNTGTSRYIGIYGTQDWRSYTTIHNNIVDQEFAFWRTAAPVIAPSITGRNAELKADLTVNIYADIDATKYPGAKMVVTIDGTDEKTIALPAAPEANGQYKFAYDGVIPSQMNDEIVASLQAADGTELDSKTFTLKSYLDAIPGSAEYAAYSADKKAAMDALIDDLLVYGREAQIKFDHNTNNLIVDASYTGSGRTSTENVLTMTPNITSQADAVAAEHGYFKNVNVIHENQNWVRVLYTDKDKDGETTFTMQMGDGAPVAMTLDGGYLCTDGIAPMDYGTVMTFKAIRDGSPIATITYSVYTYCTRKGGNAFVDALYNYGVSAAAFAALD